MAFGTTLTVDQCMLECELGEISEPWLVVLRSEVYDIEASFLFLVYSILLEHLVLHDIVPVLRHTRVH